jgi:MFS family permease
MVEIPDNIKKGVLEKDEDKNIAKLTAKEILDKIGFGFGSQQFINILFLQTGASIFLIGLINSLRVVFGNLITFSIEKYQDLKNNKRLIGWSGIVFGFSFLLIAVAIFIKSVGLFVIALILGSIAIGVYSEANAHFGISSRKAYLVERLMKYSLIITAISLFVGAYLMDKYPLSGETVLLDIGNNLFLFKVHGYLIVFEIAALSFIAAGYILSKTNGNVSNSVVGQLFSQPNMQLKNIFNLFGNNKIVLLLVITSIVVSLVQTVGYSYFAIFIFQKFSNVLFGGFMNVAMIFLISVFTSLIGYFVTKINSKAYRKFPILVFGIIMVAVMPFAYFFKLDLIFITIGTIIGVIGGSVVGVTNSLLAIDLISHDLRQAYFSFTNILSIPFFLTLAPILAYVAHIYGLSILFLSLTGILLSLAIVLIIASMTFKERVV